MKINNKIIKSAFAVLLLFATAIGFYRFSLIKSGVIDELGLYTDASKGSVFNALVFILIALGVAVAFVVSKGRFTKKSAGVFHIISSALCLVLIITAGLSSVGGLLPAKTITAMGVKRGFDVLLGLEVIFAFGGAIYFLLEIMNAKLKDTQKYNIFSLFPVLFLAVRAIRLFMNLDRQINTSERSFMLLFIVAAMMFFMTYGENFIPLSAKEKSPEAVAKRTAKYVGFGIVTATLGVIMVVFPMLAGDFGVNGICYGIFDISLCFYTLVRCFFIHMEEK